MAEHDVSDLLGEPPGKGELVTDQVTDLRGYEDVNPDPDSPEEPFAPLLGRIRDFYQDAVGAADENRRMLTEDLNFVYNSEAQGQWDPVVLQNRRGRPSYTFNRVIGPVNMVVADMRQSRPNGKVRPLSGGASQAVADILAGLCRSIEQQSRADGIYKQQYKYAVAGGYGAWRIMPEYMDDDSFDQVLRIIDIPNPQTVLFDPECNDPCAGDAMRAIVSDRISLDKYRALYVPQGEGDAHGRGDAPSGFGDVNGMSFQMSRDSYGWFTDKEVRVAEYFERVPSRKKIALMSNGDVIEHTPALQAADEHHKTSGFGPDKAIRIMRTRSSVAWQVMWVKVDGTHVLEGPIMYKWKRIPIVRCPGRYVNIDGRKKLQSLIRHSKDAARAYNSRASDIIERSALLPKAPYLVTENMISGYEAAWQQANVEPRPYLPYKIDMNAAKAGIKAGPERVPPLDVPAGAIALAQMAIQDIQATTGFFDPALGNAEDMNRVSGKALVQHTRRSDLGSYEFIDGYASALQLTWDIMIDQIPSVYDAERIERIIGQDGVEHLVELNKQEGHGTNIVNDLKKGRYDCTVTIGPSFQSARQETLQTLIDAAQTIPAVAQVCPDLLAKNIDSPDADEMARRLRIPLIKQGIVVPTKEEQQAIANMPKPPPNPVQQAQIATVVAKAQRAGAEAQIANSRAMVSELEQLRLMYETAGKHLSNLLAAQKLGEPSEAADAESTATAVQHAQPTAPQPNPQAA
jgi:Phage P22-like portal protein